MLILVKKNIKKYVLGYNSLSGKDLWLTPVDGKELQGFKVFIIDTFQPFL